jgi:pimeloyl-ACP methyl ester carboxylesterase
MHTERIHRTTSADGTEIAARVHGHGPPVVMVHGAFGSGETSWVSLLPFLTDRFTCYTMSLRGRGLSGPGDDLARDRLVDDVVAVAESLGEAVGMIGLSSGALLSLAAAERSDAVGAVAAYEPPVFERLTDETGAVVQATIESVSEVAARGRPADAAELFLRVVTNDDEFEAIAALGLFDAVAPNVPVQVREFPEVIAAPPPSITDPAELARITAPVLLLQGTRSQPDPWFADGVRHCADHIHGAQVVAIEGAGHLGPIVRPEAVATEVSTFLARALQPA